MMKRSFALSMFFVLTFSGCAGHRAFQTGEDLLRQGRYDAAVAKYAQAVAANPGRQEFRLRLTEARTRAAQEHLKTGRRLEAQGDLQGAAFEFRQAAALDPSLEAAAQEGKLADEGLKAEQLVRDAEQFYKERKFPQAKNAVQEALQLRPGMKSAEDLLARIKAQGRATVLDGFELDVASDQPITLKFRDADVREVFNILSKLSGINFIFDEGVGQEKVSVLLERATFGQALELLLKMNKLGSRVLNPKTVIIYPANKEKEKQYEDQIIQTFYLSNIDAKKAVNMLRTMLQLRKIYVHEELNALVIRDTPATIKLAQQILEASDRADSEVVFDLELVEVTRSNSLDLGPRLDTYSIGAGFARGGKIVSSGLEAGTDANTLVRGFSSLDVLYTLPNATFNFAKTLGDSEILANPKIRVKNREKSSVHIGEREPVITVTTTNETFTDNIQYVDVGVKLKVEPMIQLDNTVSTKIDLEVSSVTERVVTPNDSVALRISTTNAQTSLILRDGERTVIGGLIRDDTSKQRNSIPLVGDIPIIGNLFNFHSKTDRKRELLLSITPHIVKNIDLPRADVASIWSGGEEELKAGPNFGSFLMEPVLEQTPTPIAPAISPSSFTAPGGEGATSPAPPAGVEGANGSVPPIGEPASPGGAGEPAVPPSEKQPPAGPAESAPDGLPAPAVPPTPPAPAGAPPANVPPAPLVAEAGGSFGPTGLEIPATQGNAKVTFVGPSAVRPGEEFVLDLAVEEMRNLYSAPLFVNFNPKTLEFVRADEGDFLKAAGQTTVFSTSVDSQAGRLIIGYKQGVGGKGASGDGTLFRLRFRGKAAGRGEVNLDRINFRDPSGNRIAVPRTEKVIEVR